MGTASTVFTACGNDDPTTTFSVEPATIEATAAAASYLIAVTSSNTWMPTVSTDSEWCTLSNAIGTGGLTVNVAANTTTTTRSAIVTIRSGNLSKQITVTQEAGEVALSSITAKVSTGGTIVDAVKVYSQNFVIAEGKYENGGFTLNLLTPVPDKYLEPLFDEVPEDMTVSDLKAKGFVFFEIAAYNGKDEVGEFQYGHGSGNTVTICAFMYVDRAVKITGTLSEYGGDATTTFNLSLKKGWNKMYETYPQISMNNSFHAEISSTEPSGLEWFFDDWSSDYVSPTRVAKVANPLFGRASALRRR